MNFLVLSQDRRKQSADATLGKSMRNALIGELLTLDLPVFRAFLPITLPLTVRRTFLSLGRRAGVRGCPHPVLRYRLELDGTCGHQARHVVGQQVVQSIARLTAEVGQGVVIDLYATTDPSVRLMCLRQSGDATGMANAFHCGVKLQGVQNLRGDRRSSHAAFNRFDSGVQAFPVLPLDLAPNQPCSMSRRQQRLHIACPKLEWGAIGHQNPRRSLC